MLETLFKNQALMLLLISGFWIIPGIIFSTLTNRKYKKRIKIRQLKKISKLYPE